MTPTPTTVSVATRVFQTLSPDDLLVQTLTNIIYALVIFVVALVIGRLARLWVIRLFSRSRTNLNLAALVGNIAQVLIVVLGLLAALPKLGIELTTVVAVVGAAGLALSLSMQDLLKNIIAGIYILLEQPFKIGDRISVKEVTGMVQGIELRTTILLTDDKLQVVVPNSTVLNEIVTNRSVSDLRKQALLMQTTRGVPSELSRDLTRLVREFDGVAGAPAPSTALESVQDGSVRLRIEFWVPLERGTSVAEQVAEAIRARYPDAALTVM